MASPTVSTDTVPPAGHTGDGRVVWTPTRSSWREDAIARIDELAAQAAQVRLRTEQEVPVADTIAASTHHHLEVARLEAGHRRGGLRARDGASVMRVQSRINAAETNLVRLAPDRDVLGMLPTIRAVVRENLEPKDPRRVQLDGIPADKGAQLTDIERGRVVAALREASAESRRKMARVRSFRNVLFVTSALLLVFAVAIALVGVIDPAALPLCFTPDGKVVCATQERLFTGDDPDSAIGGTVSRWDLFLIEMIGMVAAAIAAAAALRKIRGTSTPFSLPIALALLRLPTGALTALLGLMLMRGGFVPGLSDLDSSAQILAWAIVFGYAQEVFTRLVDSQANTVLDDMGKTSPTTRDPVPT